MFLCTQLSLLAVIWAIVLGFPQLSKRDVETHPSAQAVNLNDPLFMRLGILSWRNKTGDWVSKVNLQHSDEGGSEDDPWSVEVKESRSHLPGGKGLVVIDATITSPHGKKLYFSEYRDFPNIGKYIIYKTRATWQEARTLCLQRHTDLAVINSDEEADALAQIIKSWYPGSNLYDYLMNTAHIGFSDLQNEGHYVTVDGKDLKDSGYIKWAPGNPNHPGTEDCGGIDRFGKLHDVGCNDELNFICEIP